MSFICTSCNTPQPNGTKPIKVVLETRVKVYPVRHKNNDPKDIVIDRGGRGEEIVREGNMCGSCVDLPECPLCGRTDEHLHTM